MKKRQALAAFAIATLVGAACSGSSGVVIGPSDSTTSRTTHPSLSTPPRVHTEQVAIVREPLALAVRSGDQALYIVSKRGKVLALRGSTLDPTPVLDLSSKVSRGSEQGLL